MRYIAVFKTREPLTDIAEEDPERRTLEAAGPTAEELFQTIRQQGVVTDCSKPYEGEGGWHFVARIDAQRFSVFSHWTGIDNDDYLACQPALTRRVLASLFLRAVADERLQPIRDVLERALIQMRVKHLQWLTDEEFQEVYCDGRPLPKTAT